MRRTARHAAAAGIVCALGIGTAVSSPAHAALLVDTFSDKDAANWPQAKIASYVGGQGVTDGSPGSPIAGAIGGVRITYINDVSLGVPGLDNVTATVFNNGGFSLFDYASTACGKGGFTLDYGVPAGFNNLYDIDATSYNAIEIVLAGYDAPIGQTLTIDAALYQGNTGFSLPTANVTTGGPQTITLPISPAIASQLTHNNGAEIKFDVPKGGDVRIQSISLVPEPGSLGLLLLAGPFVLRRRGRRQAAQS
jgi:hypothetical protein